MEIPQDQIQLVGQEMNQDLDPAFYIQNPPSRSQVVSAKTTNR